MGALSSLGLGGGGMPSVSPSSSASSGPQSGTTGSVVQNFGGINLGNQDIPLNASTTSATNQTPTLGNTPASAASVVSTLEAYLPYILLIGAGIALYVWIKHK